MSGENVKVYDFETKRLVSIPARELAPGMIRADVHGVGIVWIDGNQIKAPPLRHPPFGPDRMAKIAWIQQALDDVHYQTIEEWEEGFRRDTNPDDEIAIWERIVQTYEMAVAEMIGSKEQGASDSAKHQVFDLVLACSFAPRSQAPMVVRMGALSADQVRRVMDLFYGSREGTGEC